MAMKAQEMGAVVADDQETSVSHLGAYRIGLWLAVAGWMGMALIWVTRSAQKFGHDQHGVPLVLATGLFLLGWIVMVAAMMLPSTRPTLRALDSSVTTDERSGSLGFMRGYFGVWGLFGAGAFLGDSVLHVLVANLPWLARRPWLILAGVTMFAGGAEMLGRTPPPLVPSGPSKVPSFGVGRRHAMDRIRRCWPLMLFTMAIGMSSPLLMVGLTGAMRLELEPRGHVGLRLIGFGLFAFGLALVLEPNWSRFLVGSHLES
jgi:predicted metal-binding membrane protein